MPGGDYELRLRVPTAEESQLACAKMIGFAVRFLSLSLSLSLGLLAAILVPS